MKRLYQTTVLTLTVGTLLACAPGEHSGPQNSSSNSANAAGLTAFKTGFYQFAQTQNCKKCHGEFQNPRFALSDVEAAYAIAKPLLNLANPADSIFSTYAGNSHCADTPCSDPNVGPTVKNLLTQWASAETTGSDPTNPPPLTQPSAPAYVTAAVAVPANLPPLTSAPKVIRFELSSLKPAFSTLSAAVVEIEIQLSNPTTYRLNRVKIAGNTAAVQVRGLHVYVKAAGSMGLGTEDDNQGLGWTSLSATAPVFARPSPLPTGPLGATPLTTQSINIQMQSATDVITIGIEALQ